MERQLEGYFYALTDSPVGRLLLVRDQIGLVSLHILPTTGIADLETTLQQRGLVARSEDFEQEIKQLAEYFAGQRTEFDLALSFSGTLFQERVWRALQEIPYGKTVSYGQVAAQIGNPKAVRAAGTAVGHNPLPIIIPCHRVIRQNQELGGYRYGLALKRQLLEWENHKGEISFDKNNN